MIASHGSIAAAGRAVKMSYKRAWMLVEEMNDAFRDPRVESTRGGSHGGGARVTGTGAQVLAHYRKLEEQAANMGAPEIDAIRALPKTAGTPRPAPCRIRRCSVFAGFGPKNRQIGEKTSEIPLLR